MSRSRNTGGTGQQQQQRKRVTLGDVAAMAGVSVATASVAIAGRPSGNCRVSPAVAERIRKAAEQLNYRPNLHARSLSTRRTYTVAMLVKRSNWHNAMYFLASAQRLLRERGFTEIFLMHRDSRLESEREHLEMCVDRNVEGILMMPAIDPERESNAALIDEVYRQQKIPVVQMTLALDGCSAPAVVADEGGAIEEAVRRLHAAGHRRIAHVTLNGYDDDSPLNPYRHAHLRYLGYRRAVEALALEPIVLCPEGGEISVDTEFDHAVAVARRLVALRPRPTAVTTYSDFEAAGVLAGMAEAGLRVPQDVSIIGYGDQPFARMVRPALSNMVPPYEQIGERATQMLLDMIDGKPAESVSLPATFVNRQSVAPVNEG